jgi:hypothetical protein
MKSQRLVFTSKILKIADLQLTDKIVDEAFIRELVQKECDHINGVMMSESNVQRCLTREKVDQVAISQEGLPASVQNDFMLRYAGVWMHLPKYSLPFLICGGSVHTSSATS